MSQYTIRPEDYLLNMKDSIIQHIADNNPQDDPEEHYNNLILVVKTLKEHRFHENITGDILSEFKKRFQDPIKTLLRESLRKALKYDKSFNKAYIRLLQEYNRENPQFPISIEIIPDDELYFLIHNEDSKADKKFQRTSKVEIKLPEEKLKEIHEHLKNYFPNQQQELYILLQGNHIESKLRFVGNANQLAELFRRLKYNKILEYPYTELRDWICSNFQYKGQQNKEQGFKNFNHEATYNVLLEKEGNKLPKEKRILSDLEWLPYKSK